MLNIKYRGLFCGSQMDKDCISVDKFFLYFCHTDQRNCTRIIRFQTFVLKYVPLREIKMNVYKLDHTSKSH